jgi:hypothetical protein
MGGPAGVADADGAVERLGLEPVLQIDQLALGAAPRQRAALDGGDAGGIIAALFQPLQRIHDKRRDRRVTDDTHDSAHERCPVS